VVDVCADRLLPRSALAQPFGGDVFAVQQQAAAPAREADKWQAILDEFPGVSQPFSVATTPSHGVEHVIETTGRPTTVKFRRLDPVRLAEAKQEFQKMLEAGVVRRSSSCWSSPLHMVKKKCCGWRPCGDFRRLNAVTAEDKYPLPNMGDLSSRPVTAADVPKTAVITPIGLFEFVRMPFGLKNAGMTFQRLMDRIFFDLPYRFVYLDDLLVASRSVEDHRRHLREVLRRLQENGLVVNRDKCVFGQRQVEFLGHTIAAGCVSPLPDRVAAIRRFPRPSTVRELQAFLGLLNFYRRFVPAAAAILRPLTDALSGSPSG
jgi:Reverse transcriptase (RNA-dependent DNA polymerase)